MASIENNNFWDISETQLVTYCPFKEFICSDGDYYQQKLSVEYTPWQFDYDGGAHWKILLFVDTITPII